MSRPGELGRSVLLFAGLGLGWAVAARLFMRFFTDDPSFTVQGTSTIVGLVLLEFIGLGAVRGARRAGRTRWWRLAPVPGLLLFLGPGLLLMPCVLAGVVVGRCLRRWVQVLLTVVGVTGAVAMPLVLAAGATDNPPVPTLVVGLILYAACAVGLVAVVWEWSRPWGLSVAAEPLLEPAYAGEPSLRF